MKYEHLFLTTYEMHLFFAQISSSSVEPPMMPDNVQKMYLEDYPLKAREGISRNS